MKWVLRRGALALFIAATIFAPRNARADDATIDPDKRTDPKAYRGLLVGPGPDEPGLWVPRVLFFPFYLFTEYVVRRPLYAFFEWTDRHHIIEKTKRVFHPSPRFEWSPILNVDLGVSAWMGARATMHDVFLRRNDLSTSLIVGLNVFEFEARDQWRKGPMQLGVRQHAGLRDRPFYGLGPDAPNDEVNFSELSWEAVAFAGFDAGNYLHLEVSEAYRQERLGSSIVGPSIETRFDTTTIPGFTDTHLATLAAALRIDSRKTNDQSNGVRLRANIAHSRDVASPDRSFFKGEVDAQAAVAVSRPGRVLSVRFYWADTLPTGSAPVPVTDLPMLGGSPNHLGFYWGRFRGEAAVMAELRYRYPIAYDGDAQIVVSAGNVFARDFHDFDVGELTASFAVGIRTRRAGLVPIDVMAGFGTTRFDQSFAIENVRLFIGTDTGL